VDATLRDLIAARLRDVSDFPKPGIVFKDITPLLADGAAFARVVRALGELAPDVDAVAGIEARGFLLSGAISGELGCGLIPIRKAGNGRQIISARRPKRSESAPPASPATKPAAPLQTVTQNEMPVPMCRVTWA